MTLLQVFFIVSAFLLLILWMDVARKQRFNFLHIFLFIWIAIALLIFTIFPHTLATFWQIFWIQRWADVLVYISIIFLIYFVLFLFNKIEETNQSFTETIRELSIDKSFKKKIEWDLLILIRSYNEWKVLKSTIDNIIKAWYKNILLVDDWSKDNTEDIVKNYNNIVYVKHIKNLWAWAALETWFEYIRRFWNVKYVVNFDADGQHNINDLPKFLDAFKKDSNLWVVLWSRFIEKTDTNVPFFRKIILYLGRIFTLFISWVYLTDSHNGYRVFTLDTIKKINLNINGMAYASELVDKIKQNKLKFAEVPVNIKYTEYSLSKWQKSSNAIFIALKMIWTKFFK